MLSSKDSEINILKKTAEDERNKANAELRKIYDTLVHGSTVDLQKELAKRFGIKSANTPEDVAHVIERFRRLDMA